MSTKITVVCSSTSYQVVLENLAALPRMASGGAYFFIRSSYVVVFR
jgi:hypothetical protein